MQPGPAALATEPDIAEACAEIRADIAQFRDSILAELAQFRADFNRAVLILGLSLACFILIVTRVTFTAGVLLLG